MNVELDVAKILAFLVTFIVGVATGASGEYFAQLFSDRRREKEAKKRLREGFQAIRELMPDLFIAMRKDLVDDPTGGLAREFFVVSSKGVTINTKKVHFRYFENEHASLREKVDSLKQAGFVSLIDPENSIYFRMEEPFVELLKESR